MQSHPQAAAATADPAMVPSLSSSSPPPAGRWPYQYQYPYQYKQYVFSQPPLSPSDIEELQGGTDADDGRRRIGWEDFFRFNSGQDEATLNKVIGVTRERKRKRKRKQELPIEDNNKTISAQKNNINNNNDQDEEPTSQESENNNGRGKKRAREEPVDEETEEAGPEAAGPEADFDGDSDNSSDEDEETAAGPISPTMGGSNRRRTWDDYFALLVKYRDEKGNTWVPYKYKRDQPFAYWVHAQRKLFTQRKQGTTDALSDERFMYLDSIGFEEERGDKETKTKNSFKKRLAELKAFKREFKHTRVPKDYDDVPGLRKWVVKMRRLYKQGNQGASAELTQEEIDALDEIDFQWKTQGRKRENKTTKKRKRTHNDDNDNYKGDKHHKDHKDGNKSREEEIESAWWARYRQLEQFKKDNNGDVMVPKNYEEDQSFANWFNNERFKFSQRCRGDQEAFPDNRFHAFVKAGVKPNNMSFKKALEYLVAFKKEYKHTRVPKGNMIAPQLRQWVVKMRKQYKAKQQGNPTDLTQKEIDALNEIGFEWVVKKTEGSKSIEAKTTNNGSKENIHKVEEGKTSEKHTNGKHAKVHFKTRMAQLRAFKEENNHLNVPADYDKIPGLGDWVSKIRAKYKENREDIPEKAFTQLNAIGFNWSEDSVERAATKVKEEEVVPSIEADTAPAIQEHAPTDDDSEDSFDCRLAQLQAFKHQYNSTRVPKDYDSIRGLYTWTRKLRKAYHQRQQGNQTALSEDKVRALNEIQFDWALTPGKKKQSKEALKLSWFARLKQLKEYKKVHGNTAVPLNYETDKLFSHWVKAQRELFTRRKHGDKDALSDERYRALKELGLEEASGDASRVSFEKRISQLLAFKSENNHTRVPVDYDRIPGLGKWVSKMRNNYKLRQEGDLEAIADKTINELNDIGFDWQIENSSSIAPPRPEDRIPLSKAPQLGNKPPDQRQNDEKKQELTWAGRLRQLKEYKEANGGSTKVPRVYQPDQTFSNWVRTQTRLFTRRVRGDKSALSDDRFQALKNLGFQASATKSNSFSSWETRIEQLREYKEKYGNVDVTPNNPYDEHFYGWVMSQRAQFDKKKRGEPSKLNDLRFVHLQSLGFE